MIDFSTNREVVISQGVGLSLQVLAAVRNIGSDLLILYLELGQTLTELCGFFSALDFDLTRDGLELVDVARTDLVLDRQKFQVELVLIDFLEESNEEDTRFENLRSEYSVEEPFVVLLALNELFGV